MPPDGTKDLVSRTPQRNARDPWRWPLFLIVLLASTALAVISTEIGGALLVGLGAAAAVDQLIR